MLGGKTFQKGSTKNTCQFWIEQTGTSDQRNLRMWPEEICCSLKIFTLCVFEPEKSWDFQQCGGDTWLEPCCFGITVHKLYDKVLTLYKNGSCEITLWLFETFGPERSCVIEQEPFCTVRTYFYHHLSTYDRFCDRGVVEILLLLEECAPSAPKQWKQIIVLDALLASEIPSKQIPLSHIQTNWFPYRALVRLLSGTERKKTKDMTQNQ